MRNTRGFTLLEAMVALIIVALGMMAVNTQLNRYVVAASYVEQKTLASWVATNKVTELSVGPTWPESVTTTKRSTSPAASGSATSKSTKLRWRTCGVSTSPSHCADDPSACCTKCQGSSSRPRRPARRLLVAGRGATPSRGDRRRPRDATGRCSARGGRVHADRAARRDGDRRNHRRHGAHRLLRVVSQQTIARDRSERWQEIQLAMRVIVQDLAQMHPRATREEVG